MRIIRIWLIVILIAVVAVLPCHVRGQRDHKFDRFDRERAHLMLQQVYEDVKDHYYDPTYHDVDLTASYHNMTR